MAGFRHAAPQKRMQGAPPAIKQSYQCGYSAAICLRKRDHDESFRFAVGCGPLTSSIAKPTR